MGKHRPLRLFRSGRGLLTVAALALVLLVGCTQEAANTTGSAATGPGAAETVAFTLGIDGNLPRAFRGELVETIEAKFPVQIRTIEPQVTNRRFDIEGWLRDSDLVLGLSAPPSQYSLQELGELELPELDPVVAPLFEEVSRHQGRRYAVPFVLQPAVLYMNLDRLEAEGITPPPADWSLEEFGAVLGDLVDQGHPPFPIAPFFGDLLDPVLRSFGGQVRDAETGGWALDTPEARQALTWLARMVQEGRMQPVWPPDMPVSFNASAGQAFNFPMYNWGLPPLGVVYQPYPAGPRGRFAPLVTQVGCIPAESRHPELAREILTSLVADPDFRLVLARQGARPLVDDAEAKAAWRQVLGERNAEAIELGWDGVHIDRWGTSSFRAIEALTPYLTGETDLESALSALPAVEAQEAGAP